MPNENEINPTKSFALRKLPWILGAIMLCVYLFTLNRWVTLANILPVSMVSGFIWEHDFTNPLLFLIEYPFRWLPAAQVPLALNIFSAACAAITLGLLARCVAILPHDRTDMERARERNELSFLTTGSAWLPPALAVIMFGLQSGFWQHATSFTGEMVSLLPFAVIVWLLLEYRLDERPGRLTLAALIYGASMADNWALTGFLPIFITVLIWIRGVEFFRLGFLARMTLSGLVGMSTFLLLPLVGKFSNDFQFGFWEMLKPSLSLNWQVLKGIGNPEVRVNLLLMAATTFLPLLVMAIRWSASFGDSSRIGKSLSNYMFHAVHAVFFTVCIWIMLDPPFSPHQLSLNIHHRIFYGTPCLTLGFLAALCIGYFCGYYLLVFGKRAVPTRRNPWPLPALPGQLDSFSPVVYWGTFAAAALIVFTLAYKNLPQIRALNDNTLLQYARLTEQTLPPNGGILLSDSVVPETAQTFPQARTLLVQAALVRSGRAKDFLVVDTQSLNFAPYHRFLHKQWPKKWPLLVGEKEQGIVSPGTLLGILDSISKSNALCYLNPSFGYYFEKFYLEPHGLVYTMKDLPQNTLLPPPLGTNIISENQKFWSQITERQIARLTNAIVAFDPTAHMNSLNWVIMHLHGQYEPNPNALFAGSLYSRSLNYWGVQLQRAGILPAAAECFADAKQVNPRNVAAAVNLEFNQMLQSGAAITVDPSRASPDQFGESRNWNTLLNATGPFDEPSFVFVNGGVFIQNMLTHQAIAEYTRVRQLAPDYLRARLKLAQLYLFSRLPDLTLEALNDPFNQPQRFGLNESNSIMVDVLAADAHIQKKDIARANELFNLELSRHPDDAALVTVIAQTYLAYGLYTNALQLFSGQIERNPDDPRWLFGQGYANLQMTNYDKAIGSFTRVLQVSTNNPDALLNRGIAYFYADRLTNARSDFAALQSGSTNLAHTIQAAYALGEIAWKLHDTNEAVRNYQLLLANAPTNAAEFKTIRDRLNQLQKK
jgi:tetratricopeptide (TPR) repeat protein